MMLDVNEARHELLDQGKGFFVVNRLFAAEEADAYREYCERFLVDSKRIQERIMSSTMQDYTHPRSHDQEERTARIYQYFHNHRGDMIGGLLERAIALRDAVEAGWLDDPAYRAERESLFDYVIVTKYYGNRGMLPKHRDYNGPAPLPLVQFWVALSEPGQDYSGGNLVLYSKNGQSRRVETDLDIHKGDGLLFDKSLQHEVELTQIPQKQAVGRWTALIGARAPKDSAWSAAKKRWLYGPPLYPIFAAAARMLKRLRGHR